MSNRKNHNSILFLTTLGVYLCLLIFGSGLLYAQATRDNYGVMVDMKPVRDFAQSVKRKVANKEIDLGAPFLVEVEGYLTQDGKLDIKRTKVIRSQGDEKLIAVVSDAIAAVGDSGWLGYLRNLDVGKFVLGVSQDETNFAINILSDVKQPNNAKRIASSLSALLEFAVKQSKNEDDKLFLDNMTVSSIESSFKIDLIVPQSKFQESLSRALNKTRNE